VRERNPALNDVQKTRQTFSTAAANECPGCSDGTEHRAKRKMPAALFLTTVPTVTV
jgi:hypothetical protein